jgi:hypothetical protein
MPAKIHAVAVPAITWTGSKVTLLYALFPVNWHFLTPPAQAVMGTPENAVQGTLRIGTTISYPCNRTRSTAAMHTPMMAGQIAMS